jgi:hypothetical protein
MATLTKALTMFLALIFLKSIASGKRVETNIIFRIYSFLDLVFGNGPTQLMIILLYGSSIAGMGCNCALGIVGFGLPSI